VQHLPAGCVTVAISHDGKFVATGTAGHGSQSFKSTVVIHDAKTLTPVRPPSKTPQWVSILKPVRSPNGFLAALSNDPNLHPKEPRPSAGSIVLFSVASGNKQIVAEVQNPITSIALSPDERMLAVCSGPTSGANSVCTLFSFPDGKLITTFSPKANGRLHATFPNDSTKCLILCSRPGIYRAVPDKEKAVKAFLISTENAVIIDESVLDRRDIPVYGVARSRDDGVVVISSEWWIGRCEVESESIGFETIREGGGPLFAYHPGRHLAAKGVCLIGSSPESYVDFTDMSTGKRFETHIVTRTEVADLAFSPDGNWLFAIGFDGESRSLLEKYDLHGLK
jgi:WD40 repeat protein